MTSMPYFRAGQVGGEWTIHVLSDSGHLTWPQLLALQGWYSRFDPCVGILSVDTSATAKAMLTLSSPAKPVTSEDVYWFASGVLANMDQGEWHMTCEEIRGWHHARRLVNMAADRVREKKRLPWE